ncbi:MAG: phosphatase PAP2 family protein [Acidobacteria bacterium]|nr:phosphatase PAP2 family protein [Acidobacteriota bacterium]
MKSSAETRFITGYFLAGLALAACALVFFAWLADEVLEGDTLRFDDAARMWVHHFASPTITTVMRIFTTIGSPPFLAAFGAGIVIGMWYIGWLRGAYLFVITIAGAGVLDFTLKLAFHRPRPHPFFNTPVPHSYSFPSGHALFSVCVWGFLAAIVARRTPSLVERLALWMLAGVLITLIGFSRIYLGVHYPSACYCRLRCRFRVGHCRHFRRPLPAAPRPQAR